MHNDDDELLTSVNVLKVISSYWLHMGTTFIIAFSALSNYEGTLQDALLPILLLIIHWLVSVGGYYIKDDLERTKRYYVASLALWLAALAFVLTPSALTLLVSVTLIYMIVLIFNKYIGLIATLLLVLSLEVGWLVQVPRAELFDLRRVSVHSAALIIYWLVIKIAIDQSKRSKKDISLSSERQRLRALINSMADGVIATDEKHDITMYNGAALDVLNVNVSLEGQDLTEHLHLYDENDKRVDLFSLAGKARSNFVTRDLRLNIGDEEYINVYISVAEVRLGYGKDSTMGYIVLIRDITKEKSLEEERDEFISVVSHELRTPVTVVEGSISNAEILLDKGKKPKIKESLEKAHENAIFLAGLINDLATLSRAERGKLEVDPESVDVYKLLKELQSSYFESAKEKGLKIELKRSSHKKINTSKLYLEEILQNFITNSIKYTDKGSVSLSAEAKENGILVHIKDTGIGISKSDQKKLFHKFFRSEDFRTREKSGTGLGLYVTLKLAHLIGAKITVESKLNEGSEFSILVPDLPAHHHRKR